MNRALSLEVLVEVRFLLRAGTTGWKMQPLVWRPIPIAVLLPRKPKS